jgi:hypothetical protein
MLLTPIQCMQLQLTRNFSCTCECAEREEVARQVLLDLCKMNSWHAWLNKQKYNPQMGNTDWEHGHFDGENITSCSFDDYVIYHPETPNKFRVNDEFIKAMNFDEEI